MKKLLSTIALSAVLTVSSSLFYSTSAHAGVGITTAGVTITVLSAKGYFYNDDAIIGGVLPTIIGGLFILPAAIVHTVNNGWTNISTLLFVLDKTKRLSVEDRDAIASMDESEQEVFLSILNDREINDEERIELLNEIFGK